MRNRILTVIKTAITLILTAAFAFVITGEMRNTESLRFKYSPVYRTVNRWYTKEGRKVELNDFECSSRVTLCTVLKNREPRGTNLIIKKCDLKIFAFTKNKIIYKNDECEGTAYVIIPVDEVLKGEEITLVITPYDGKTGYIDSTVRLQTNNEFLMLLIAENAGIIIAAAALILIAFGALIKRKAELFFAFSALTLYTILKSELYQFLFGSINYARAAECISLFAFFFFIFTFLLKHLIIALKGRMWYNTLVKRRGAYENTYERRD